MNITIYELSPVTFKAIYPIIARLLFKKYGTCDIDVTTNPRTECITIEFKCDDLTITYGSKYINLGGWILIDRNDFMSLELS